MTYTSLVTRDADKYARSLSIAHLYGDLMNTYGDNGNILMLRYVAEKCGAASRVEIVSLGDSFDPDRYDLVFWGGGQDFEQAVVAEHLPEVTAGLRAYVEAGKPMLAICGGYQMLGRYYVEASGRRIEGTGILRHHTLNQGGGERFIGDVELVNDTFGETYYGFENHGGRTFLADDEAPLGRVVFGSGNNGEDGGEGLHYKGVFGSYLHGPILSRNPRLAYRLVTAALRGRYGDDVVVPAFEDVLAGEEEGRAVADVKRKAERA